MCRLITHSLSKYPCICEKENLKKLQWKKLGRGEGGGKKQYIFLKCLRHKVDVIGCFNLSIMSTNFLIKM